MSIKEMEALLIELGVSPKSNSLGRALARAGTRIARDVKNGVPVFRLMQSGRDELASANSQGALHVLHFKGDLPFTDRISIKEFLGNISGIVRVCDSWYGAKSLETLAYFPEVANVRFLTGQCGNKEDKRVLAGEIRSFKKERPNTQLKLHPNPSLMHDRYIMSRDTFTIVGHGLKDIGQKESFVVPIPRRLMTDLAVEIERRFDDSWNKGQVL
jgi:hypothetical protein